MPPEKGKQIDDAPEGMEEREPIRWNPTTPGESLRGIYFDTGISRKYQKRTIFYIENDDGQFFVFGNEVLENRMKPYTPGEFIEIRYTGTVDSENFPNPMRMYRVFGPKKKRAFSTESAES